MEEDPLMDLDLEMQLLSGDNNGHGGTRIRQLMQKLMLVAQASVIFTTHASPSPSAVSRVPSSKTIHNHHQTTRVDIMEEAGVDLPQTAPLLKTVDNTSRSRKQMRTLFLVLHSTRIFKAHAASAATACVHHGSSDATQKKPAVADTSDGLSPSSGRKTTTNETTVDQLWRSQGKNISEIVRDKDLPTLREFGGLSGAVDALGTDLVRGLSDGEAINRSGLQESTPAHKFCHWVLEALKNKTILLLLVAAVLSLGFGIEEEGLQNGWYDGVIVLITICLLVLLDSVRKYWQERRTRKKLQKQQVRKEGVAREVHVIREGEAKYICESKLVCGDVMLLKKGSHVAADGLFVDGQALELDYGSKSRKVDEQIPFLSYGERVINGDARMLVTGWSEMISKATGDEDTRFKLEAHLHKLNTCIHYTGLLISILIVLVLFFRYMAGKMDEENGYRLDSMTKPTSTTTFGNIFGKIIKESKYRARALTKLLSVSLIGVTEGVPFVVSLAIFYWNHVTLMSTEQDSQAVAKMASVTRICTDTFGDFAEDEMVVDKLFIGGEVISGCTTLSPNVVEALCDGICTLRENAVLLDWAKEKFGLKRERMKQSLPQMYENESVKESLERCTHYYTSKGQKAPMDVRVRSFFEQANEDMRHKQLSTIAFACIHTDDLILVALLGLKNKSREATKAEVKACRDCRIETVIVSSEKVSVVKDIALQCGVITIGDSESLVITGDVFRSFTDKERLEKVGKIRGLGEALPSDKLLLVETLRENGEVVVFLGQRTDEAPSLRGAEIGIAMGTWSSINARQSSDIIMCDGSFGDLIRIVNSGKCIHHNMQRFLQLVLITTISSTLINFWETAAYGDASLTIVQLVWVNLAVDFLGGFALLTQSSMVSLVPISYGGSLITAEMGRNIVFQVLYQVICSVILHLKGSGVVGTSDYMKPVVSNSFIFSQFFNQFNARELQKKNFFKGIHRHTEFWVGVATFIVLHAALVMIQDILGYGTRLTWKLWVGCVLVGVVSWLVDSFGKFISHFIRRFGCCLIRAE